MLEFAFFRPKTLDEALAKLDRRDGGWRVLAGGTDLLLSLRERCGKDPEFEGVVDITCLKELRGTEVQGDQIVIGSLTTFSDILGLPPGNPELEFLARMSSEMGSVQIRNRATIGGNLVNASPCADSVPPLLALDATVELVSTKGVRSMPLEEFILGPGRTKIKSGEILARLSFQRCKSRADWVYTKVGRRNSATMSRMTVAALRIRNGTSSASRVAIGAVTPKAMRLRYVERILDEGGWTNQTILRCGAKARQEVEKITGNRWSSAYKLPVIENVVRRALKNVVATNSSNGEVVVG